MRLALRLGLLHIGTASLLAASACGDDGSGGATETDSDSTTSTSSGADPTTVSDPTTADTSSTGSVTTATATTADTGSSSSTTDTATGSESSSSTGPGVCRPLIVEVVTNPVPGGDDELQWVKLYNPCTAAFDFDVETWSLGWAGQEGGEGDYAFGGVDLEGQIAADDCYVVGGPTSQAANGNPVYDLDIDLAPDLRLGEDQAFDVPGVGVALFDVDESNVEADTVPIDAVVYGDNNDSALIDETGSPVANPHVAASPEGGSLLRTAEDATWQTAVAPDPGTCPPF